jgi:hypothetical protein
MNHEQAFLVGWQVTGMRTVAAPGFGWARPFLHLRSQVRLRDMQKSIAPRDFEPGGLHLPAGFDHYETCAKGRARDVTSAPSPWISQATMTSGRDPARHL